jgi:hypothetical protein
MNPSISRPGGAKTVDEHQPEQRGMSLQGPLGYLNFSNGKPDPRFQKQINDAFASLADHGIEQPWLALRDWFRTELDTLKTSGAAAFRDSHQVEAVLAVAFDRVLPAYRRHHADLLAHQTERDLFQPFFLARVFEAVLAQGSPWDEPERNERGALRQLNDFVGYRPVAILETRPRGEPYEHEKVRPIPLYLRGAGVAWGRYHDLIARALDILTDTSPDLLAEAEFDLQLLDELALDPRAYHHGHPANRRPNHVFGEWDPHHLDGQGRFRRFVVRQLVLDALLDRALHPGAVEPAEALVEAAAVLAGTLLMAAGISGGSPTAHDSATTLGVLLPRIARYRDAFYARLLGKLGDTGPHGARLRQEAVATRQPFGGARQHLNQYLARDRAVQVQQRSLALLFAEMGFPEASRREAARIPVPSVRLLSDILGRLATAGHRMETGQVAEAVALLPEAEDLLHRGIACGAFADPWNILGFQGLFPLSPAREDSVRDPRIEELIYLVEQILNGHARALSEAAAAGRQDLLPGLLKNMKKLAAWWDRFASVEVGEVRRVHGGEAAASAEHVAGALARWRERGEATADLAFWRRHLEGFRSPKAFALVVEALLRKQDYQASMALLINWLGQAEQVPLEEGEHSFHGLALRWMLGVTGTQYSVLSTQYSEAWPLVRKFFDYLEANAEEYWEVPILQTQESGKDDRDEEEELYSAAYEGVTYRDTTDDDEDSSVADGGGPRQEFSLEEEGEALERRLRFLSTLARLWLVAARQGHGPDRGETLRAWLDTAEQKHGQMLELLDALNEHRIPEPSGSQDSLMEYDRRRVLKEQLLYTGIATCLDLSLAVGALHAATGSDVTEQGRPPWEPAAIRLEQAILRGDPGEVRALLPPFLERFRDEPLLFVSLADGGQPRFILRARLAQTILRALVATLPRLGLLRETYHLLKTARAMEQAHSIPGRGVTEFNPLFQVAYQAVVEAVVDSAETWTEAEGNDAQLVGLLETLTGPFLSLWAEHSRTLQLSALEAVRSDEEWEALRDFIRRYGSDLFHARFMSLANLRGILHRGVGAYLDYLAENPDPLHPVKLIDELEHGLAREPVVRRFQVVLQAIIENYEEYKDYNTTVVHSDYGENLYLLLDFLRLKASYDRYAWQFRPLVQAHEVLARTGRETAAVRWEEALTRLTRDLADRHLEELAHLQRSHGMRLGTIADHLQERFVKPLALDRLCALIEPAVEEAGAGQESSTAFVRLQEEVRSYTATPTGVGLDVPAWLRRLALEVQRVRATRAVPADNLFQMPQRPLSFAEVQQQLAEWE